MCRRPIQMTLTGYKPYSFDLITHILFAYNPSLTIAASDWISRLARTLMRLPALRLMSSSITEELFFTGLIGNVPIDSIIPYILKMESADYNNQITGPSA